MNIQSYTVIHYGIDYVGYALRSVYDCVDQLHVVYTPHPSHGIQTDHAPPESKERIIDAVFAYDPAGKIRWHGVTQFYHEGQHRDHALEICRHAGADVALVIDCDEVWPRDVLERALMYAWEKNEARNWLINFTHLWRSFNWCCRDQGWPVRIIDFRHADGVAYIPQELGPIYHFGYAVHSSLMAYKWLIHGHKGELRPEWWGERWQAWPPMPDCHPTNRQGWWNPEPFDKIALPLLMRTHPFYDVEMIP